MARRRVYTSAEEHLTTGKRWRMERVSGGARGPSGFISRFRSMPGASPAGEMSMISEVRPKRITGRRLQTGMTLPSRMPSVSIDPQSIKMWYDYAMDFRENADMFRFAVDKIIGMYALISLAGAQKRSLGPVDPQMTRAAAAWKIPVRRISGMYFLGWEVKHMGIGVYMLTNNSREAYYIEFGINHVGTGAQGSNGMRLRIRRPVMKLSVLEALKIIQATHIDVHEVVAAVTPSSLYQSPKITGAYRPKNPSGSAIGLVDIEALQRMAGGAGGNE